MILWVKRGAAVWSGIFLVALLYSHTEIAIIGGILNLAWVVDEKLRPTLSKFIRPSILMINTVLSAYGVLKGAPSILAVLIAGTSLLSWNAGLFLRRWRDAPLTVQYRYLKHLGVILAVGLGTGLCALTLQGHFSLRFFWAFLLMFIVGFLWLRIISKASRKESAR
jgi:hypothetical protein